MVKYKKGMDIQELAKEFYATRTETAFTRLYKQIYNLGYRVSYNILKNHDDAVDNLNVCFVKLYEDKKYVFDETKKYVSYFMVVVKNEALRTYNKNRIRNLGDDEYTASSGNKRFITESFMFTESNGDDNDGVFQMLLNEKYGGEEMDIFTGEIPFYESEKATASRIDDMIDSMFQEGEYDAEIMRKLLFEDASVSKVAESYGFPSRITISSRKRRGLDRLRKILEAEKRFEQVLDGYSDINGTIRKSHKGQVEMEGQVVDSKLDGMIRYYKNGELYVECEYSLGKKHGIYKKYIDNKMVLRGFYEDGEQTGIWKVQGVEVNMDKKVSNMGILDLIYNLLKA